MNKKIIEINERYFINIVYNNDITRLYQLIDRKKEEIVLESFNRDSFLLRTSKVVKITNKIELLVASI